MSFVPAAAFLLIVEGAMVARERKVTRSAKHWRRVNNSTIPIKIGFSHLSFGFTLAPYAPPVVSLIFHTTVDFLVPQQNIQVVGRRDRAKLVHE